MTYLRSGVPAGSLLDRDHYDVIARDSAGAVLFVGRYEPWEAASEFNGGQSMNAGELAEAVADRFAAASVEVDPVKAVRSL